MTELGTVAAELLHDLAGTIGVLDGRIALARQEAATGQVPSQELVRMERDCRRLQAMILDVMEELQGRSPSPEDAFEVETTLREVVESWLPASPSLALRFVSDVEDGYRVSGRRSFFARAVLNLLRNASRHAHGELLVALRPESRRGREGVLISVEDDGGGVLEEIEDRLFEPMVSGVREGAGLGLSLVRWASERLKGEVSHRRSAELGGAAFDLWVPVSRLGRGTKTAPASEARGRGPLAGLSVAVVDDDPALRRVYRRLLDRGGATPRELDPASTPDLTAAIRDLLTGGSEAVDPVDVVLLDVNLGVASGVRVWDRLHEEAPEHAARVLLLTGGDVVEHAGPGDQPRPVVSKLSSWTELAERIRTASEQERPAKD